jgi:uncharacterized protein DUF6152
LKIRRPSQRNSRAELRVRAGFPLQELDGFQRTGAVLRLVILNWILTSLGSWWDIPERYFPNEKDLSNRDSFPMCWLLEALGMKNLVLCLALAFTALFISAPLAAHHGETNYDTEKMVSVKGTVTDFQFINPHTQIFLDVKNDKGEIEKWSCEARSPAMLVRNGGWDKNTLKPGDVITASGFRAKNGTNILRLKKIVLADGHELPDL